MGDLSKNFSSSEFACKHCRRTFIDKNLVDALQALRDVTARPIEILSGYRCVEHNKKIGGSQKSMHVAGKAADIQVEGVDTYTLLEVCLKIPEFTGVGFYPQEHFVHVDTRPGARATWARVNGKYTSLEEGVKQWHRSSSSK